MDSTDIEHIEKQLRIKLPAFYVSTMLQYPFSEASWGAEFSLCNYPEQVISLNGIFTQADECFSIGSDGGEFYYFIKLDGGEKVYIFDLEGSKAHMSIEADNWPAYLRQIEIIHDEHKQEALLELERKKHKKWWQFWI